MWPYLSRSTGIVATVLAVAALVYGFFFSSRNTGKRRRPNWWLDLHNWLGGLALIFIGCHLVAVYLSRRPGIGLVQIVIPATTAIGGWGITWGVLAMYLFAAAVLTSWPKRRFSRRVWRVVHLGSVMGVGLAGVHGYQSGSDSGELLFLGGLVACAAVAIYALSLRLLSLPGRGTTLTEDSQQGPSHS